MTRVNLMKSCVYDNDFLSSTQMQLLRDKDNQGAGTNKHTNIIQNGTLAYFMSYVQHMTIKLY